MVPDKPRLTRSNNLIAIMIASVTVNALRKQYMKDAIYSTKVQADYIGPRPRARPGPEGTGNCSSCYGNAEISTAPHRPLALTRRLSSAAHRAMQPGPLKGRASHIAARAGPATLRPGPGPPVDEETKYAHKSACLQSEIRTASCC